MIQALYTILYTLGIVLLIPVFLIVLWVRSGYRKNWWQRVGYYTAREHSRLAIKSGSRCWIDAISIGEVQIALHFIAALRQRIPSLEFVLTTRTPEGHALAERRRPTGIDLLQFPCDLPASLRSAFGLIQPDFIILVETNLWPNHLWTATARHIPVFLINVPMPPAEARRYRLGGWFVHRLFRAPALVCAQNHADAERLRELGVPPERLHITGSLKYDVAMANASRGIHERLDAVQLLLQTGASVSQPVLVAGSTHDGEEAILFDLLAEWRMTSPKPILILAPRDITRALKIAALGRRRKLAVRMRTEIGAQASAPECPIDCLVLDTVGELPDFYKAATIIFVGKSLVGHGGQNIMEAAASGRPVLFGPNMENFQAAAEQFLAEGGAVQVRDADELRSAVERLLRDANERERIAAAAQRVIRAHAGATERTLELLLQSLKLPNDLMKKLG